MKAAARTAPRWPVVVAITTRCSISQSHASSWSRPGSLHPLTIIRRCCDSPGVTPSGMPRPSHGSNADNCQRGTMPGARLARPSGPGSSTMIRAISILLAEQRPLGPGGIDASEDLVPNLRGVCGVRADGRDVVQRGAECNRVGPTLKTRTGAPGDRRCSAEDEGVQPSVRASRTGARQRAGRGHSELSRLGPDNHFFNGERHQRQIDCAGKKINLIVSHPRDGISVDTRPKAALKSRRQWRRLTQQKVRVGRAPLRDG